MSRSPIPFVILELPSEQTLEELGARYAHVSRKATERLLEAEKQLAAKQVPKAEESQPLNSPLAVSGRFSGGDLALPRSASTPLPHSSLPGASSSNPISIVSDDSTTPERRSPHPSLSPVVSGRKLESILSEVLTTGAIVRGEVVNRSSLCSF